MGSIWKFIAEPKHYGAEGSAVKDFLYSLDTDVDRHAPPYDVPHKTATR